MHLPLLVQLPFAHQISNLTNTAQSLHLGCHPHRELRWFPHIMRAVCNRPIFHLDGEMQSYCRITLYYCHVTASLFSGYPTFYLKYTLIGSNIIKSAARINGRRLGLFAISQKDYDSASFLRKPSRMIIAAPITIAISAKLNAGQ